MNKINSQANIISMFQGAIAKGPVLVSQVFDRELMSQVEVLEMEVANKSRIPENLPFGLIVQIVNEGNSTRSRLRVRVGPGFYGEAGVEWPEVCTWDEPRDNEVTRIMTCVKVVPIDAQPEHGEGIWESVINPIDARHGLRVTKKDPVLFRAQEYTVSIPDVVPPRFKALRKVEEFTETVKGTAMPPAMLPGDVARSEQQVSPMAKRVMVQKLGDDTNATLDGSRAYTEGVRSDIVESLLDTEPTADTGLQIISSEVTELGNGQFVKTTETAPSWPVFRGSRVDEKLNASVGFTEQMVSPPGSTTAVANVEYTPVNADRTLKRVLEIPVAALDSYTSSYPTRVNMNLPRVLKKVQVVWNASSGAGSQDASWQGFSFGRSYSLSCNIGDSSSGSAAASPEFIVDVEEVWASNLPATSKTVIMKLPITEAQLLAKFGAKRWPVFKPASHTIVGLGQSARVTVNVAVNASSSGSESSQSKDAGKSSSTSFDMQLSNNSLQIPPTIHDAITLQGELTKAVVATATASMGGGGFNFPSISASAHASISLLAKVFPTSLPATRGTTRIPSSGIYMVDSNVEPYKYGYALVNVVLLDASVFA